jgi:hypothetical protein
MKRIDDVWYVFEEEEFLKKLGINGDKVLMIKDVDRVYSGGRNKIQICLLEEEDA